MIEIRGIEMALFIQFGATEKYEDPRDFHNVNYIVLTLSGKSSREESDLRPRFWPTFSTSVSAKNAAFLPLDVFQGWVFALSRVMMSRREQMPCFPFTHAV